MTEEPADQDAWHEWFAWHPVMLYQDGVGGWVWLKTIERRWWYVQYPDGDHGAWEYRPIVKDTGGDGGDEGRGHA
jgi:hypothetical protein